MNEKALSYLDNSDGWEIGTAPNVVVVDEGAGASLTTTSATEHILVFFFDQKGIMAGVTIQGPKLTPINPESPQSWNEARCAFTAPTHEARPRDQIWPTR